MAYLQARKRPDNLKKTLKRFLSYLGNHKLLLFLVIILVSISSLANLFGTYMFRVIIDEYTTYPKYNDLWKITIVEASIYLVGAICTFCYSQIMARLAQRSIYEMRRDMFNNMQYLELKYFDSHTHGFIMSNFINDIDSVSDALNNAFAVLISNFIHIVGLMVFMFIINFFLAIVCLLFYICMFLYVIYASKRSKKAFYTSSVEMAHLNGYVEESITGQKVIKVFNHEEENINKFKNYNEKLKKASFEALRYSFSMVPMVVTISYINYAIVAILGGMMALGYISFITISLGEITSMLLFVRQGTMPINQFTNQANILLNGLAGAERIFNLMDEVKEVDQGNITLVNVNSFDELKETKEHTPYFAWKDNETLIPLKGDVRFFNVDFAYITDKMILKDLSLYAKPGQKIAFVGPTGAGKTTITNLLNRFYEINSGKITIDSIDIKKIKKDDLRRSLAIVLQDTHLFTGTIKENIMYGNLDAKDEDVIEASKLANAHGFISRLPEGYDTMIYADGANLSTGQRQLISIARAAISKRPILILDEATSSIDTRTESLVERGMDSLMEGKTVLVIAHRLSTVQNSNAIMVLEKGKIIERGTHTELVREKGLYYKLASGSLELE